MKKFFLLSICLLLTLSLASCHIGGMINGISRMVRENAAVPSQVSDPTDTHHIEEHHPEPIAPSDIPDADKQPSPDLPAIPDGNISPDAPDAPAPLPGPKAQEPTNKFGFEFIIPNSATSSGMEDGTFDINFGEGDALEAFISVFPPETSPFVDALSPEEKLDIVRSGINNNSSPLIDIYDEVYENTTVDGKEAVCYFADAEMLGIPFTYVVYYIFSNGSIYNFMVQRYTDDISPQTEDALSEFMDSLTFTG